MKPQQTLSSKTEAFAAPNVISVIFDPEFKMATLQSIRFFGINRTQASLEAGGMDKRVAKAVIRNIIRKYGW